MKIAFIGYGQDGAPLADQLQRMGHTAILAATDPNSENVKKALARNAALTVTAPHDAVRDAEVVFLAIPFKAVEPALTAVAAELHGKILVACTNPVGRNLSHELNNVQSGLEWVQKLVPETKVVKAFTIYGFENFEDSSYPGYNIKPVMMYCGQDATAKATVGELIAQLGWQPLDVGGLEQAFHLEHMTPLHGGGAPGGHSPNIVWAALTK